MAYPHEVSTGDSSQNAFKRLFDSQLSQQGQLLGFVFGAFFGGLLTTLPTYGIKWLNTYNLFTQTTEEVTAILGVALGIVAGIVATFLIMTDLTLRFKIRLLKDYAEARELLKKRKGWLLWRTTSVMMRIL